MDFDLARSIIDMFLLLFISEIDTSHTLFRPNEQMNPAFRPAQTGPLYRLPRKIDVSVLFSNVSAHKHDLYEAYICMKNWLL